MIAHLAKENLGKGAIELNAPIEIMRFTLYYDGPLPSASKNARLEEKHLIRRAMHPQLLELYRHNASLPKMPNGADWAAWPQWEWPTQGGPMGPFGWTEDQAVFLAGDLHFVPLVRRNLDLICELDVLFLRHGEPGAIIQSSGDIDNRILTLSDGLRIPKGEKECAYVAGQNDLPKTDPIFCLLEDDSLITRLNIKTDRLLTPLAKGRESDVRLIMEVQIKASRLTWANIEMAGG